MIAIIIRPTLYVSSNSSLAFGINITVTLSINYYIRAKYQVNSKLDGVGNFTPLFPHTPEKG